MKLTDHFTFEELIDSDIAARRGIPNVPNVEISANLVTLAQRLEEVRHVLYDRPIRITSGYRCPRLNKLVGGSPNSAHMQGLAADFVCPGFGDPEDIAVAIGVSEVDFDQCIVEFERWIHFAIAPKGKKGRRQVFNLGG